MRLWKVWVRQDREEEAVVYAEDADEACDVAADEARKNPECVFGSRYDDEVSASDAREITSLDKVPRDWRRSTPLGGDDSVDVLWPQIEAAQEAAKTEAARKALVDATLHEEQSSLFGATGAESKEPTT